MITTALFDIDGTLVDSNYLHVDAWERAFAEVGSPVDSWRIHRAIGMDSAELLRDLVGQQADTVGERAKERHSVLYRELAGRLRPFRAARELLAELARRGLTVVLATSAPQDELETLRAVLQVDPHLAATTSADDVGTAKPAPDIIEVALRKVTASAAEAIMIGDSIWDVKAAARAQVPCIGVLSGGVSAAELRDAGAVAVYADVAELLENLDDSPLVAGIG